MNTVCTQAVSSFSLLLSLALGLVKLGCSSLGGLAVVRGDVVSCLSTGRSVARQQHFRLLDAVDQGLPKPLGSVCFVFLLLPQPTLGVRVWPLNLLHTLLSLALGFCQSHLILTDWSD